VLVVLNIERFEPSAGSGKRGSVESAAGGGGSEQKRVTIQGELRASTAERAERP